MKLFQGPLKETHGVIFVGRVTRESNARVSLIDRPYRFVFSCNHHPTRFRSVLLCLLMPQLLSYTLVHNEL